jgi:hypothetical protein
MIDGFSIYHGRINRTRYAAAVLGWRYTVMGS